VGENAPGGDLDSECPSCGCGGLTLFRRKEALGRDITESEVAMTRKSEPGDQGFKIVAKVIRQEGHCDAGHKVGDEVVFDGETVQGRVCISALYSFLAKVFAMRYGANFPWLEDPDVATHACPDAANPVVFEIRRFRA
jgi:uncharacterized repeat protein (TIGR04076 family)